MNSSKSFFHSKSLFYAIFLIFIVSCSFKKQFKSTKSIGNKIYPIEFANFIEKLGFYSNLKEMYGSVISFYLQDSSGNPACFEKCFLYQKGIIVKDLKTDNSGILRIRLSNDVLNEDSYIISENPDYNFNFSFNASGDRENNRKVNVIMLDSLNFIPTAKNTLIFLPDTSNIDQYMKLSDIKFLLDIQYKIIKDMLHVEPKRWGIALSLKEEPIHFYEPLYFYNGNWHHLFAYSLKTDSLSNILLTNMHEWTELSIVPHLKSKDQNIRWLQDGIAELSLILFAENLTLEEREKYYIQTELKNKLNKYFIYIKNLEEKGGNNIDFDLTKWKLASANKVYSNKDMLGYPLSLYFWLSIREEYGLQTVSEFFTKAKKIENARQEDYIKILSKITGKDIKPQLSFFNIKSILNDINLCSHNLQISLDEYH